MVPTKNYDYYREKIEEAKKSWRPRRNLQRVRAEIVKDGPANGLENRIINSLADSCTSCAHEIKEKRKKRCEQFRKWILPFIVVIVGVTITILVKSC